MIEPTDEMRRAAYDALPPEVRIAPEALDDVLAAVLALVERDYRVEPRPPWELEHLSHREDAPAAECPFCPPTGHVCESPARCWGDPDCPVYSSRRSGHGRPS